MVGEFIEKVRCQYECSMISIDALRPDKTFVEVCCSWDEMLDVVKVVTSLNEDEHISGVAAGFDAFDSSKLAFVMVVAPMHNEMFRPFGA